MNYLAMPSYDQFNFMIGIFPTRKEAVRHNEEIGRECGIPMPLFKDGVYENQNHLKFRIIEAPEFPVEISGKSFIPFYRVLTNIDDMGL